MKIVLMFDGLDGKYREYELTPSIDKALRQGHSVTIEFMNPCTGNEVFHAKDNGLFRKVE